MARNDSTADVAHLLRRFGLGASEAEVDAYSAEGYQAAVERLLDPRAEEGFDLEIERFANERGVLNVRGVQIWWMVRLLASAHPLEQKLTLFWHDHFATSASKVNSGWLMHQHLETLRAGALGSFPDLVLAMSQDPAMLFWLDNQTNVAGKPNENFGREVLELFTLGIGHYSEEDVREAARAFTGWTIRRPSRRELPAGQAPLRGSFEFRADLHDAGEKRVLGQAGLRSGEEVIALACDHPQTARHLVRKFWEWFVYPDPEPALVDRLAAGWRAAAMSTRELVRAVALSPEFRSERARRAVVKNPIDFVVPTLRALGAHHQVLQRLGTEGQVRPGQAGVAAAALLSAKAMGMEPLFPPDVAGWEGQDGWLTSATMVERIKWADTLYRGNQARLFAPDPSAEGIVRRVLSLFDAEIPSPKVGLLVEAAGGVLAENRRDLSGAAHQATRLLFGSPEFQFS